MAFLKKITVYLPEILALFFLIVILWILFLPHLESPFRIKLSPGQARQALIFSWLAGSAVIALNYFYLSHQLLPSREISAPIPKAPVRFGDKPILRVTAVVFLNLLLGCTYYLAILAMLGLPWDRISFRSGVVAQPFWSLLFCLGCAAVGVLLRFYRWSVRQVIELSKKEKETVEIGLTALKHQLNPHFLFNVLNNIDARIHQDPGSASEMLVQLSKMMRYVIYEESWVSLSKEMVFLEQYIRLQSSRNEHKLQCRFIKNVENENEPIAPAIFLPYIENAFKHCDLSKEGNRLFFNLTQTGDEIIFTASNPVSPNSAQRNQTGKGLTIAEKRLKLFYGAHYSIVFEKTDFLFFTTIRIWKK